MSESEMQVGGSKISGLKVSKPKGVAATHTDIKGLDTSYILQKALKRGVKRMEYVQDGREEDNEESMGGRCSENSQDSQVRAGMGVGVEGETGTEYNEQREEGRGSKEQTPSVRGRERKD